MQILLTEKICEKAEGIREEVEEKNRKRPAFADDPEYPTSVSSESRH